MNGREREPTNCVQLSCGCSVLAAEAESSIRKALWCRLEIQVGTIRTNKTSIMSPIPADAVL